MSERTDDAAKTIYLDACVKLLNASRDKDQEIADLCWAFTEMLERLYPGVGDKVREENNLPPKPMKRNTP